jgi:transposase-like protein
LVHSKDFKGRQFTAEVILWAVRRYLLFPVSYRDFELMLLDRGVEVHHTTISAGFRLTPSILRSGSGLISA